MVKFSVLLACILLEYLLCISIYKAHINALFCMTILHPLILIPKLNYYVTNY